MTLVPLGVWKDLFKSSRGSAGFLLGIVLGKMGGRLRSFWEVRSRVIRFSGNEVGGATIGICLLARIFNADC